MSSFDWLERAGVERSWLDQLSSVALSLLLASLIWLVASEEARPIVEQVFPGGPADEPEIMFRDVPDGLSVYNPEPRTARLHLRGIEDGFRGLDDSDFEVWADLSDQSVGTRSAELPLSVRCVTSCRRRGIRVLGPIPEMVSLRLSPTMTRTMTVELMPKDDLPPGYLIGSYVVTPTTVAVVGATVPASRVRRVVAEVSGLGDVHGEHLFENVPVVPLDSSDRPVLDLIVEPNVVDVQVSPSRSQAVAVVPAIQGEAEVAEGYFFSGVWVEPKVVELDGPADLVRDLGNSGRIYTIPVDLAGASGDAEYSVALDLPEGVRALNALDGVTVTVEIEALPGTRTLELPIDEQGLRDGLVADITPDRVQVLLSGPEPDLEALGAAGSDDVVAYVDLTGLGPGAHRVAVRVDAPSQLRVGSTTPEEVEVVIRSAAGVRLSGTPTQSGNR